LVIQGNVILVQDGGESGFAKLEIATVIPFSVTCLVLLYRCIITGHLFEPEFVVVKLDKAGAGEVLRVSFEPSKSENYTCSFIATSPQSRHSK